MGGRGAAGGGQGVSPGYPLARRAFRIRRSRRFRTLLPTALGELGYVEGQNLVVDRRFGDDKLDRLPGLARELVQLRPDVIVAVSGQAIQAVRDATSTIPIVMVISTDPVARGLVASFSRPGGNVTGITTVAETSLAGKRLELLKEAVPKAARIAVLASGSLSSSAQLKEAQKAAPGPAGQARARRGSRQPTTTAPSARSSPSGPTPSSS